MDKYRKVEKPKETTVKDDAEIRVTAVGSVSAYVSRAAKVYNELEKPQVIIKATGNALTKAVTLAEVIKRRFKNLHQITTLANQEIVDEYEPLEEGLDKVTDTRNVSVIEIQLSKEPLDTSNKGYQPPIDVSLVTEFDPEQMTKPRGRGKGRGGGGRGKGKGKGKLEDNDKAPSVGKSKGKSKGKGKGDGKAAAREVSDGKGKRKGKGKGKIESFAVGSKGSKGVKGDNKGKNSKGGGKGSKGGYDEWNSNQKGGGKKGSYGKGKSSTWGTWEDSYGSGGYAERGASKGGNKGKGKSSKGDHRWWAEWAR